MRRAGWLALLLAGVALAQDLDLPVGKPTWSPLPPAQPTAAGLPPAPTAGPAAVTTSTTRYGSPRIMAPAQPERDPDPPLPPVLFWGELIPVTSPGTIVYVLDRSCSMAIEDLWGDEKGFMHGSGLGSRLAKAKRELLRSVSGLVPPLRFNVVTFDCFTEGFAPEPVLATEEAKQRLATWLQAVTFRGGTGTAPACLVALAQETRAVVLLTDGEPGCDRPFEWHRSEISRANTKRATIDVFGIGVLEPAMREFCVGVASDSGGSFRWVR